MKKENRTALGVNSRGGFGETAARLCGGGFEKIRLAVVGDLMLDHYISGAVNRISPEAPVPVVRFENESYSLGGSGNVARNLKGLGVQVSLISAVGVDEWGSMLLRLAGEAGIDMSGVARSADAPTTVKTRILGGSNKQMLRIDRELYREPDGAVMGLIGQKIQSELENGADAVIISDYGKGFCSPETCALTLSLCRGAGVPVFVDPKGRDWAKYSGAYAVTPNIKEISDAAGCDVANTDDCVVSAARTLLAKYNLGHILVTRSDKGATLVGGGGFYHERCGGKEVYDVSGAGDTMIAVAAAFAAGGVPLRQSVTAANAAAQLVIQKFGTAAVTAAELLAALSGSGGARFSADKEAAASAAAEICAAWKTQGKRVVFTNGCFDILHTGHLDSLRAARSLGDKLIVGLNSDSSVRRLKGDGRPVLKENDRARMLLELETVDLVVIFDEDTPEKLLSLLRPNIIAKGGDYAPQDVAGGGFADEVVILPLTEGYSTTGFIEALRKNG